MIYCFHFKHVYSIKSTLFIQKISIVVSSKLFHMIPRVLVEQFLRLASSYTISGILIQSSISNVRNDVERNFSLFSRNWKQITAVVRAHLKQPEVWFSLVFLDPLISLLKSFLSEKKQKSLILGKRNGPFVLSNQITAGNTEVSVKRIRTHNDNPSFQIMTHLSTM